MSRYQHPYQQSCEPDGKPKVQVLDLSTPERKSDAREALPALVIAGMLGNGKASIAAGEVIGDVLSEALRPSFQALHRLNRSRNHD